MIDATTLAARRHSELHPGFHLVAAVDAAIPVSWLTLDVLALERKPLPVVDEFVLRLCGQGVDTVADIAAVLGMDDDVVRDSVATHLSVENLDYRPDPRPEYRGERIISLTGTGERAVDELEITAPHRTDLTLAFDRLLWASAAYRRRELIHRGDAANRGLLLLPSARTHDVTAEEITPRTLNRILSDSGQGGEGRPARRHAASGRVEVLAVEAVTRQPRRYLPAVLLIYAADGYDDIRLTVVVDDLTSQDHDRALTDLGGADKLGITVAAPVGEPPLPPQLLDQRAPHDRVRGLQRRADATIAEPSDPDAAGAHTDDDAATARAELDALTVRSVPTFEHRELLAQALDQARRRFLLIAAAPRSAVVTDDFVARLETMLRRPGLTAHIAYWPAASDSESDAGAVKSLNRLAERHGNLTVARLDEYHPHCLIFDNTWINSSFDWLSYRGGTSRTYRRDEGTLIRAHATVDDHYSHCSMAVESVHRAASNQNS